ncbi:MAG TPA: DUF6585 family protein [Phototrophicaceae bacterium]|jgi:hypothetical protein|nr:DUF6585 family protein [Phototrophicaceae bacterium]
MSAENDDECLLTRSQARDKLAQSDLEDDVLITDDPVYGAVLANYPSDRGRLLLIGGGIYLVVSIVLNLAFARVDASLASIFVIGGMSILALIISWYVLHLWNREVILYTRGFSYREGSRTLFFAYHEILSIRQRAERVSYFGGLIRRTIEQITLKTDQDETIVLDSLYRRIDELGIRLEQEISQALRPIVEAKLQAGAIVPFGEALALTEQGIRTGDQLTLWSAFQGFTIGGGKLTIYTANENTAVPLASLENPALLLTLLRAHHPPSA